MVTKEAARSVAGDIRDMIQGVAELAGVILGAADRVEGRLLGETPSGPAEEGMPCPAGFLMEVRAYLVDIHARLLSAKDALERVEGQLKL